ncbi:MAG: iron-only hydrogenase system regulator [Firmicutes bacterium]|jgi:putative iron-only hydrogenase system regulator|nr:iron-only hydrogenase system regulator [Bacillota bacterium]
MDGKRVGVIGVVVENPKAVQQRLNDFISQAGDIIIGRMGIPQREQNVAVIALLVDGTTDDINTLTGQLGSLPGVSVRAALTRKGIGGTQDD